MVAIGNQWFWTYEVTKVLKLVDTSTLTIPVLAKQSIMLRKRTSVKNLKVIFKL